MSDSFVKTLSSKITRRGFLTKLSQGVAATSISAAILKNIVAAQPQVRVPDPPGRRAGALSAASRGRDTGPVSG